MIGLKLIRPYIATIFIFNIMFILTMIIDNNDLYLGFGKEWREVITNNKLPIQREVFINGLVIVLTILYIIERYLINQSRIQNRILKTTLTVIVIYIINWGLFEIIGLKVTCLYHYSRGTPAPLACIGTLMYLGVFIGLFELITKTKLNEYTRGIVLRLTPAFIRNYYRKDTGNNSYNDVI